MKRNTTAATTTQITNRLIAAAQTAVNADVRERAMRELWEIHGPRLVGVMAKTSYRTDSDFDYRGLNHDGRCDRLTDNAYFVFHDAVMAFDVTEGVPFAAYIAQKGNWRVADEKRENSKRSAREYSVDFSLECISCSDIPGEIENLNALRRVNTYKAGFDEECFNNDVMHCIGKATEPNPRLHRYWETCLELMHEGYEYSDAEVARRLGCTRANVGVYKKNLVNMLKTDERFSDICLLMAA